MSPRNLNRYLRLLTWMSQHYGTGLVTDLTWRDAYRARLIVLPD